MAFILLAALALRTPSHSAVPCLTRSSQEKLSGSDFINQYCCAAMLFPFRWGARTVKGITSAENGSFRALQISRATFIGRARSEEHTSELQSLMRISYAVFCLKKNKKRHNY